MGCIFKPNGRMTRNRMMGIIRTTAGNRTPHKIHPDDFRAVVRAVASGLPSAAVLATLPQGELMNILAEVFKAAESAAAEKRGSEFWRERWLTSTESVMPAHDPRGPFARWKKHRMAMQNTNAAKAARLNERRHWAHLAALRGKPLDEPA